MSVWVIANTTGGIISHTTVISIAYLASPDSSDSLGIIIYFFRRKYPAGKAAKGLIRKKKMNGSLTSAKHKPFGVAMPVGLIMTNVNVYGTDIMTIAIALIG